MNNREKLIEYGYENSVVYENPSFDEAIVGVDIITGAVIYNYNLMVQCLTKDENMTVDEAIDFIDYNTTRATPYMPEPRPIILNEMII